ncbi:unnamed protein product [Pleuronectes platessa]|uniref:Uncharacterized protein n=1 Tax=Pleuronectes platessa TaxID=8262 RepID=A0A9N7UCC1_PLEPL|nr:unnamed protein product [Pleuronectes platessa]
MRPNGEASGSDTGRETAADPPNKSSRFNLYDRQSMITTFCVYCSYYELFPSPRWSPADDTELRAAGTFSREQVNGLKLKEQRHGVCSPVIFPLSTRSSGMFWTRPQKKIPALIGLMISDKTNIGPDEKSCHRFIVMKRRAPAGSII